MGIIKTFSFRFLILMMLFSIVKKSYAQLEDSIREKPSSIEALAKVLDRPDDSLKVVVLKLLCWENRNSDPAKAIEYGQMAVALAHKLELNQELSDSYNRLGVAYRNVGEYAKALDCYFKGLEISRKYNLKKHLAFQYNNLADLYNRLSLYDRAVEFGKRALDIAKQINDEYTLSYIYNILGTIYQNKDDLDSALYYFGKSLELREKIGFSPGIATAYLNIGNVHLAKGKKDSSEFYIIRAQKIYSQNNDLQGLALSYLAHGILCNQLGQYDSAIFYFNKGLATNRNFENQTVSRDCHKGLSYSYKQKGDFKKAEYHSNLAYNINDSITLSSYVERLTQLTEALRFEEQVKHQKEREKILAEKIGFQRNIIKLYIAIIVLLTALIGLAVYFYLKRAKDVRLLRKQKDEINQLNNDKDRYFSILAHDLKNQLTSIVTIAQIIKEKSLSLGNDEMIQLSKRLYVLGFSTNDLLENVLNWIKSQEKRLKVSIKSYNLKDLVDRVIMSQKPAAELKSIGLVNKVDPTMNVNTDADMLSTILRNFISNAIKFSVAGGEVEIEAAQIAGRIEVSVRDYGVGMTQQKVNSLFSKGQQKSQRGTSNEQGSGIGLAICNQLATDLGGEIKVASKPNEGSTFTIVLPLADVS
ncbi:tetratricopeptide repeat-containing sensor histidine kinase [Tenuifilum sp.]|jgi:signal transduction histidine kinase|uniref:tetratricopeptide repeat-containing sensor histidine kinase n=1 Tax=Tenuifilum sp. TaxID=2760880 RepID=UPI00258A4062|nr:tetratricopeptide repeat-containing sensor histidine kinase [Tenuifilum sp.]